MKNVRKDILHVRVLRHIDRPVTMCVGENGQKTYYDAVSNKKLAYSSGAQVKTSIQNYIKRSLADVFPKEKLVASMTFEKINETKSKTLKQGQCYYTSTPDNIEISLRGNMAISKGSEIKRRSPLSISYFNPISPNAASITKEAVCVNRTDPSYSELNTFIVRKDKKDGEIMNREEVSQFLESSGRKLEAQQFNPDGKILFSGLYFYDVAIDLSRLFSVCINDNANEISNENIEFLKNAGWTEATNIYGKCLLRPESERKAIASALADAVINWRVESNQSSALNTVDFVAASVSFDCGRLPETIFYDDMENHLSIYQINDNADTKTFASEQKCKTLGVICDDDVEVSRIARDNAVDYIESKINEYNY